MAFPYTLKLFSYLLFYPPFYIPKAFRGITDSKVIYPSPEYGIYQVYYPAYRLRPVPVKYFFELSKKSCSGFYLWYDNNCPFSLSGFNPSVYKSKKAKSFSQSKVYCLCFLDIYLYFQFLQFLDSPLVSCRCKPFVVIIYKNYQVSSPGESHPEALSEPDMSFSAHPAPIIQSLDKYQFANERTTLVHVWQSCRASI